MENKGRIYGLVLTGAASLCILLSCIRQEDSIPYSGSIAKVCVRLQPPAAETRTSPAPEIEDLSLIVFNQDGIAERCMSIEDGMNSVELDLIAGRTYSFYALMNFGYHVFADHISEMEELVYHRNASGSLSESMPMSGICKDVTVYKGREIVITMERLYAEIRVKMDRSRLSDEVSMKVTGVRIGNSPAQVKAFSPGHIKTSAERFEGRLEASEEEVGMLNMTDDRGISGEISLYMLENMQGDITDFSVRNDSDKVFQENDPRRTICSFLEIDLEYLSLKYFSHEGPLKYRTYLGDGLQNLDVERNCIYTVTICPEDDGLSDEGWRVDKTWLQEFGPSRFVSFPESYIHGDIGDTLHLWCEFYPPHAPFDVGLEELEYDSSQGIYEYIIDKDGHGVRLILKNPGTGIIYMTAGEPVNESAMWVVVVNRPESALTFRDTLPCMSHHKFSTAPGFRKRQVVRPRLRLQVQDRSPNPQHG